MKMRQSRTYSQLNVSMGPQGTEEEEEEGGGGGGGVSHNKCSLVVLVNVVY